MVSKKAETMLAPSKTRKVPGMEFTTVEVRWRLRFALSRERLRSRASMSWAFCWGKEPGIRGGSRPGMVVACSR
jgi:hypothetical protein